eukprot:gnl/TRDRNA2_/TRDRNA2_168458_c0_seq1.p1 gnl/TRDRNA2_/TRDRNA2_168458_c0~~gnl/TRDRNA2_/TRDRNA2_168458_c0_seq1.p1  ORF type:complete len:236 (+),score=57.28 gnl/TRDRNA2_/TRDRNA2_168458_c0_seq1:74-709(+)
MAVLSKQHSSTQICISADGSAHLGTYVVEKPVDAESKVAKQTNEEEVEEQSLEARGVAGSTAKSTVSNKEVSASTPATLYENLTLFDELKLMIRRLAPEPKKHTFPKVDVWATAEKIEIVQESPKEHRSVGAVDTGDFNQKTANEEIALTQKETVSSADSKSAKTGNEYKVIGAGSRHMIVSDASGSSAAAAAAGPSAAAVAVALVAIILI